MAKFHIMTALVVVVFSLLMTVGVVYAKYIKSVDFSGNVTISAELVGDIELFEHKAVRVSDGGYTLGEDEVTTNSYILMPGVDVPKDPQIRITNKTAIDAYLYVEVVDSLGSNGVSYAIDETIWTLLGIKGKNGGDLYVYYTDLDETFNGNGTGTINILEGNLITVSDNYNRESEGITLTFHAYMAETIGSESAEDVFTSTFNT